MVREKASMCCIMTGSPSDSRGCLPHLQTKRISRQEAAKTANIYAPSATVAVTEPGGHFVVVVLTTLGS